MEGYFKREKDKNYLIFEKEIPEGSYKYRMLLHNRISGLLNCRIYHVDNTTKVQYDISSKQSLKRICEKKHLNRQRFEAVLVAIQNLMQELARYFLSLDEVFLNPEYIYADMETFELYFCCYPDKEQTLAEKEFHQLAEYLINYLDYEDKEVIEKGYALYRYTMEENYDIEKSIQKARAGHLEKDREEIERTEEEEENWKEEDYTYKGERQISKIAEGGIFNHILTRLKGETKEEKELDELGDEIEEYHRESVVEVEEEEEMYGHTMLLKETKNKPMHYLVCLSEGGYQDFSITKFPFVIGKGKEWADGVIPHNLISRIHAQLEEEAGEVYITDLNSTNGTGVNEELLEANQTVQLKSGDIINFSEVYYRFV